MYVALEGCIACGKSSTAELLAQELGLVHVHEQTSRHPFIADFYADPVTYALETEIGFVLIHYHQLRKLAGADMVADFAPAKDFLFGEMNLHGEDFEVFRSVYAHLASRSPQPDVAIFLDLPVEECLRRALARGRPYESGLQVTYLESLRSQYLRHLDLLGKHVERLEIHPRQDQRVVVEAVIELLGELGLT
jgi:deoxyguanosine kinase